ncbi:NAD(P)/FAD-dependent oxidoreductase [Dyadobacter sandarakinus]|uniref:NADH:ubiquinone reductase (non-electrogenic) n=1 Tax=Dyadobacter sandarakinus TaxID=2747268 RepID=A0ABX7I0W5_9BACT|nr:NAD(P)/FAD-dependent oxidoreductase [Dyadobacter sandarakinus]QRQ99648.1 NAD(P)/FAD-dependent oxidoreductase [Dyadobacter sandarakinus]
MDRKKVVIVGGGFAGINLAQKLSHDRSFEITLVDKNNYNFFPPLLYQVATGFLEASNISYPYRKFFQNDDNMRFSLGEFQEVFPAENRIRTDTGDLHYDYLVFATGTESNFFGMENVQKNSVPMKTVKDALALRNHILLKKEQATKITDPIERRKILSIVVAGAGPTGVEVSGMLAEMHRNIFKKDYPELNREEIRIYLVDALPVVLNPMSKKSQEETLEELRGLGIEVLLDHAVKDYQDGVVTFANGKTIATETLIWTSGVTAVNLPGLPKEILGRGKRVMVDGHNRVKGTANIYAIGDICLMNTDEKFPDGHPQLAQVAIQQGRNLARNLRNLVRSEPLSDFHYKDKGTMAIIGFNKAVADLPGLHFKGFIAYFLWLVIHLFSLIRYRNRVKTFSNWMVAFFTRDQSLRFIMDAKPDK